MTPPLIFVLGPTASGKSAIAMALAERFPLEIVSVDSAQVYRDLNIGTAKPDAAERARVPHHLIDLIDPAERYSAARFADDARVAIAAIRQRGRLPLLVGGTMLYARALTQGFDPLPSADPALRERLEQEGREHGWPAMHARLAGIDPVTAARLAPMDAQRIQRALEVFELTGRPMSALLTGAGTTDTTDTTDTTNTTNPTAPVPTLTISIEPSRREVLHQRIGQRFDRMLADGLVDEVAALHRRPELDESLPSIRCVGYRQVWGFLDRRYDHDSMREQGIAATRQLAKRQLTWLRSMPQRHVIDSLRDDALNQVIRLVDAASHGVAVPSDQPRVTAGGSP